MIRDFAKQKLLDLLQSRVGDLFEDFVARDLEIGLWDGKLVLHNIRFRQDALVKLSGKPGIKIVHGQVKTLSVVVPWASFGSQPVTIELEGVHIQLEETTEDTEPISNLNKQTVSSEATDYATLVAKVLQSVEVTVRDVNLTWTPKPLQKRQFKTPSFNPAALATPQHLLGHKTEDEEDHSTLLEVRVDAIHFFSCNANGEPIQNGASSEDTTAPSLDGVPVFFHKKFAIDCLSISTLYFGKTSEVSKRNEHKIRSGDHSHQHSIHSHAHSHQILTPLSVNASFALLEEDLEGRPSWISLDVVCTSDFNVHLDTDSVELCLEVVNALTAPACSQDSNEDMNQSIDDLGNGAMGTFAIRPQHRPGKAPQEWWKYACKLVALNRQEKELLKQKKFEWLTVTAAVFRRSRYIELYKSYFRHVQHDDQNWSVSQKEHLDALTRMLPREQSIAYQEMARAQVVVEQQREGIHQSTEQPKSIFSGESLSNEEKFQIILDTLAQRAKFDHYAPDVELSGRSRGAVATELRDRTDSFSRSGDGKLEDASDATVWAINISAPSVSLLFASNPVPRHDFGGSTSDRYLSKRRRWYPTVLPFSLKLETCVKVAVEIVDQHASCHVHLLRTVVLNCKAGNAELLRVPDLQLKVYRDPLLPHSQAENGDKYVTSFDLECNKPIICTISDSGVAGACDLLNDHLRIVAANKRRGGTKDLPKDHESPETAIPCSFYFAGLDFRFAFDASNRANAAQLKLKLGPCALEDDTPKQVASIRDWTFRLESIDIRFQRGQDEESIILRTQMQMKSVQKSDLANDRLDNSFNTKITSTQVDSIDDLRKLENKRNGNKENIANDKEGWLKVTARRREDGNGSHDQLRVQLEPSFLKWNPDIILDMNSAFHKMKDTAFAAVAVYATSDDTRKLDKPTETVRRTVCIHMKELEVLFFRESPLLRLAVESLTIQLFEGSVNGHAAAVSLLVATPSAHVPSTDVAWRALVESSSSEAVNPALVFVFAGSKPGTRPSKLSIHFLSRPRVTYMHQAWLLLKDYVAHGIVGVITRLGRHPLRHQAVPIPSPEDRTPGMSVDVEFRDLTLCLDTLDCSYPVESAELEVLATVSSLVITNPWRTYHPLDFPQALWTIHAVGLDLGSVDLRSQKLAQWTEEPVEVVFHVFHTDVAGFDLSVDGSIRRMSCESGSSEGLLLQLNVEQFIAFREILGNNLSGRQIPETNTVSNPVGYQYHAVQSTNGTTSIRIDFGDAILKLQRRDQELENQFVLSHSILEIGSGEIRFRSVDVAVAVKSTAKPTHSEVPLIISKDNANSQFALTRSFDGTISLSFQNLVVNLDVSKLASVISFLLSSPPRRYLPQDHSGVKVEFLVNIALENSDAIFLGGATEDRAGFTVYRTGLFVRNANVSVTGRNGDVVGEQAWKVALRGTHIARITTKPTHLDSPLLRDSHKLMKLFPHEVLVSDGGLEIQYTSSPTGNSLLISPKAMTKLFIPVQEIASIVAQAAASPNDSTVEDGINNRAVRDSPCSGIGAEDGICSPVIPSTNGLQDVLPMDGSTSNRVKEVATSNGIRTSPNSKPEETNCLVQEGKQNESIDSSPNRNALTVNLNISNGILVKVSPRSDSFAPMIVSATALQLHVNDPRDTAVLSISQLAVSVGEALHGNYKDLFVSPFVKMDWKKEISSEQDISLFVSDSSQIKLSKNSIRYCIETGQSFLAAIELKAEPKPRVEKAHVLKNLTGMNLELEVTKHHPMEVRFSARDQESQIETEWEYFLRDMPDTPIPGKATIQATTSGPGAPSLHVRSRIDSMQKLEFEVSSGCFFYNAFPLHLDVQVCSADGIAVSTIYGLRTGKSWHVPVPVLAADNGAISVRMRRAASASSPANLGWGDLILLLPLQVPAWVAAQQPEQGPWTLEGTVGSCGSTHAESPTGVHSVPCLVELNSETSNGPVCIRVGPTVIATNTLPFDIEVHVDAPAGSAFPLQSLLPSGSHTALVGAPVPAPNRRTDQSGAGPPLLTFRIRCGYGELSDPLAVPLCQRNSLAAERLQVVDQQGHASHVRVEVVAKFEENTANDSFAMSRAIKMVFFAPICILNRSTLPLSYFVREWYEPHTQIGTSTCVLLENAEGGETMQLRLGSEKPSLQFPIDSPGISGPIVVPVGRAAGSGLVLGVAVTQGTGEFHRTKYITIVPRVMVVNNTGDDLKFRLGAGRLSQMGYGANGQVMTVSANSSDPVLVPTAANSAALKVLVLRARSENCGCPSCLEGGDSVLGSLDVENMVEKGVVSFGSSPSCELSPVAVDAAVLDDGAALVLNFNTPTESLKVEGSIPITCMFHFNLEDCTVEYEIEEGDMEGTFLSLHCYNIGFDACLPTFQPLRVRVGAADLTCGVVAGVGPNGTVPLFELRRQYGTSATNGKLDDATLLHLQVERMLNGSEGLPQVVPSASVDIAPFFLHVDGGMNRVALVVKEQVMDALSLTKESSSSGLEEGSSRAINQFSNRVKGQFVHLAEVPFIAPIHHAGNLLAYLIIRSGKVSAIDGEVTLVQNFEHWYSRSQGQIQATKSAAVDAKPIRLKLDSAHLGFLQWYHPKLNLSPNRVATMLSEHYLGEFHAQLLGLVGAVRIEDLSWGGVVRLVRARVWNRAISVLMRRNSNESVSNRVRFPLLSSVQELVPSSPTLPAREHLYERCVKRHQAMCTSPGNFFLCIRQTEMEWEALLPSHNVILLSIVNASAKRVRVDCWVGTGEDLVVLSANQELKKLPVRPGSSGPVSAFLPSYVGSESISSTKPLSPLSMSPDQCLTFVLLQNKSSGGADARVEVDSAQLCRFGFSSNGDAYCHYHNAMDSNATVAHMPTQDMFDRGNVNGLPHLLLLMDNASHESQGIYA